MGNDTTSQIEYYARAMKAPRIGEAAAHLADQARDADWTQKENLPPCPPGTGKTHLAIGLGIKAAHAGHRVPFGTATQWVARLQTAHRGDGLPAELERLRRYGLIIVDEVGYIPFEQDAANLFFQLVSSRYEHASLVLTSNLPFARWATCLATRSLPPR